MTTVTTFGRLLSSVDPLRRLGGLALPLKAAYHLTKLRRLVDTEIGFFQERRTALVKELGDTRPPTEEERLRGVTEDVSQVKPDEMAAFQARVKELLAFEVTLPWGPFDLRWLAAEVTVSSDDLLNLSVGEPGALAVLEDADADAPKPGKTRGKKSI